MEDEGSAGATVENTQEPMAGEAGIPDLSEGAWAKNFNGWAMEVSPAGIGFIRICNGRPNEVYRRSSAAPIGRRLQRLVGRLGIESTTG